MSDEQQGGSTLSPSIVVLKTGEKLITILQEVFEGEGDERKGICLLMNYPYELELVKAESQDNPELDLQVKYTKWCPYAVDTQYRIPYDGILTIGVPDPGLSQVYQAKVDAQQESNFRLQQEEINRAVNGESASEETEPAITPEVV